MREVRPHRLGLQQCGHGRQAGVAGKSHVLQVGVQQLGGLPLKKPKHMSTRRYVSLLDQRACILSKIRAELVKRRRFYAGKR